MSLARRMSAEFAGTAFLLTAVVGSGISAARLSPQDAGLELAENVTAIVLALGVLILMAGPVSGAHFNPVVSAVDWWLGRRTGTGLTLAELAGYVVAQITGAFAGAALAGLMFGEPVTWSGQHRGGGQVWLGEVVATGGLIVLIVALARTGRSALAPTAVGAYVAAACWCTSSTSFANPAVTIGRAFTDTMTGIAPVSVPGFIAAQALGGALAVAAAAWWYPEASIAPAVDGAPVSTPANTYRPVASARRRHRRDLLRRGRRPVAK